MPSTAESLLEAEHPLGGAVPDEVFLGVAHARRLEGPAQRCVREDIDARALGHGHGIRPRRVRDGLQAARVGCRDGTRTRVQHGSTEQLIFDVPELVARLSQTLELLPGDLVFTGTPPGVGMGREPQRFLQHGEQLTTEIEGIGAIVQRFHR